MRSALSAYRFSSLFFLSCSTCKSLPSWFVCQSHFLSNPDHAYTDISHDHAWNETSSYNQYRSFHSNRLDRINFSYVNVRIFACALLSLSDSCTFYSLWQSDYWRLHINTCSNFCTMEILRFVCVPYDIPQLCESSAVQFKSKSNAIASQPNASIR